MKQNLQPETIKARTLLENSCTEYVKNAQELIQEKHPDFKLESVKYDWSPTRTAHRGGIYSAKIDGVYSRKPGINMAMYRLFSTANWILRGNPVGEPFRVHEYAAYDSHPIIGGFYTDNIFDRANAYICHEVAHAIQFHLKNTKQIYDRPHGDSFKLPYALLRKNLVNPLLPNQIEMEKKYKEFIKTKVLT